MYYYLCICVFSVFFLGFPLAFSFSTLIQLVGIWDFWPAKSVSHISYTVLVETLNHAQSINWGLSPAILTVYMLFQALHGEGLIYIAPWVYRPTSPVLVSTPEMSALPVDDSWANLNKMAVYVHCTVKDWSAEFFGIDECILGKWKFSDFHQCKSENDKQLS